MLVVTEIRASLAHNIAMEKEIIERLRERASQHFLDSISVKQEAEREREETLR
jgi:D-sedoheptulose 7-phosphate isomerase